MSLLKPVKDVGIWVSKTAKAAGVWASKTFDVRDVMLAAGLAFLSIGLWQVWPPAALIVPGSIITAVAIFANRIDGSAGED